MGNKIIIIGGGPSGMMAAIIARRNGSDVILLERNNRVGKKLLTTGNGRCNYTNLNLNINNYHGNNPSFAEQALSELNVDKTLDFFESLGITPADEDNGKVYPLSFQASSMLDILRFEMEFQGVNVITDAFVSDIKKKDKFIVRLKDDRTFLGDKVILATRGMAMPVSGSDGTGYTLAKSFGHSVTDIFPGLVQLKLEGSIFKQINGVKFIGTAGIYHKNRLIVEDKGDILFTDYGISGPPILQISRKAMDLMNEGQDVEIRISILSKTKEEVRDYLQMRFNKLGTRNMDEVLIGMINKKLIIPILKENLLLITPKDMVIDTPIQLKNLVQYPFIMRGSDSGTQSLVDKVLKKHDVSKRDLQIAVRTDCFYSLIKLVELGTGISLVS